MEKYCKTRGLRALLIVAGVALTLTLASGDTSVAQTAPALSFLTSGGEPLTVELENQEEGLLGTVDAVIVNDSDYEGPLTIEFITRESGDVTTLGADSEFPENRLGFFTTGSAQPSVEPFATTPIPLRFGGDETFAQQSVEGVVVARATDGTPVRPATLQVTVVGPEVTSRWSEAKVEPASVTIIATRWWPTPLRGWLPRGWLPLSSFNREAPVWIRDVGSGTNVAAGEMIASTRLSSDTGGNSTLALVTQADLPEQEQQEVEGIIEATDISRAGTYTGSLALNPAVENSPKTTVTLKARDLFLWPLLALLGGAALAWGLIKRRDEGRPKNLLLSELMKAFETYRKAKKANPDCTYHMGGIFPKTGGWMSCESLSDNSPKAQIAYCEIYTAKTKEDFDKVVAKVRDIQELVALWPQGCQSAKELGDALKDLPDDVPIRGETEKILAKEELPADTKAMKDLLELYSRQTQAVKRWIQGQKLWNSGRNLYETLRTRDMLEIDKAQLNDNDPEVLYKVYLEPAVSLDDLTKPDVIARLRESVYVTMALNRAYPPPTDYSVEAAGAMQEAQDALKEAEAPPAPMQPSDITQALARALLAYVPSEEIVSMVRVHDKWDFVITASLTMLAFLVTLYVGTNFGSIWQYLAAFLAGATGQLVINWALLPWYRSYKIASSTPAKPATGGA